MTTPSMRLLSDHLRQDFKALLGFLIVGKQKDLNVTIEIPSPYFGFEANHKPQGAYKAYLQKADCGWNLIFQVGLLSNGTFTCDPCSRSSFKVHFGEGRKSTKLLKTLLEFTDNFYFKKCLLQSLERFYSEYPILVSRLN